MKNKTMKKKLGRPAIYTPEEARLRKNAKANERYANFTPEQKLWVVFSGYMSKALNIRFATPEELEAIIKKEKQHDKNYYHGAKGKERNHPSTKEAWARRVVGKMLIRHNELIEDGKIAKDSKFDLTPEFILKLLNKQNLQCIETGTKFTFGTAKCPYKPSLDRIDNNKGYEKKNLRLVTVQVNYSRRDYTLDQHQANFVRAAEFLKKNDLKKYKMLVLQIESK
jgi:hypothetical protein